VIKSISFKNYKSFKINRWGNPWKIDIKPITILVGPNSGGKSAIIKLFGLLHQSYKDGKPGDLLKYDGPDTDLVDFKTVSHKNVREPLSIEIHLDRWAPTPAPDSLGDILPLESMGHEVTINKVSINETSRTSSFMYTLGLKKRRNLSFVFSKRSNSGLEFKLSSAVLDKIMTDLDSELNDMAKVLSVCSGSSVNEEDIKKGVQKIFKAENSIRITNRGINIVSAGETGKQIDARKEVTEILGIYGTSQSVPDELYELSSVATGLVKLTVTDLEESIDKRGKGRFDDKKQDRKRTRKEKQVVNMFLEVVHDQSYKRYHKDFAYWLWQYIYRKVIQEIERTVYSVVDQKLIKNIISPTLLGNLDLVIILPPVRPVPKRVYSSEEIELSLNQFHLNSARSYDLMGSVSKDLQRLGFPYSVRYKKTGGGTGLPEFYTLIVEEMIDSKSYNYVDTGFGLSQVLPIIMSLHNHRRYSNRHPIIAIEQPELHLHPKAQSRLSSMFVHALRDSHSDKRPYKMGNLQLILETHSEHLVRGFQVEVAKGNLSKDDMAIYYVGKYKNENSYVKKLEITEKGMFVEPWPGGFFEEDYRLTKELLRHQ